MKRPKVPVSRLVSIACRGSCVVGSRQARPAVRQGSEALLRRLTRSHRTQLDGDEVVLAHDVA